MKIEEMNKMINALGESIFENEPSLHPGNLTIAIVRVYAESGNYSHLSSEEFEELIRLTYLANHIVHG